VGVGGEKLEAEPPADNSIYNDLGFWNLWEWRRW